MSIKGQGHSLTLVKGHSDFKVKCLSFGLYTQVSDSGPLGPLVSEHIDIQQMEKILEDVEMNGVAHGMIHCSSHIDMFAMELYNTK